MRRTMADPKHVVDTTKASHSMVRKPNALKSEILKSEEGFETKVLL
jgi:hypothetical protein